MLGIKEPRIVEKVIMVLAPTAISNGHGEAWMHLLGSEKFKVTDQSMIDDSCIFFFSGEGAENCAFAALRFLDEEY